MTPLAIEILIHYYCTVGDFRNHRDTIRAPAVAETIGKFITDGLLEVFVPREGRPTRNAEYAITDKGVLVVKRICDFDKPVPMLLWCPGCGTRHIDNGKFATKPHHTHACQQCGVVWRPAVADTVGVQFLPGYKNNDT